MEKTAVTREKFEPELYCLRCQGMEWDDETRRCANFNGPRCPLTIRSVLADLKVSCLVV
ncbi:MAG: hypothetical protein V1797_06185 [Pseudomonadota bacterium]